MCKMSQRLSFTHTHSQGSINSLRLPTCASRNSIQSVAIEPFKLVLKCGTETDTWTDAYVVAVLQVNECEKKGFSIVCHECWWWCWCWWYRSSCVPSKSFRLIYFRLYLYCMTECPIFPRSSYSSSKDVINELELAIGTPAAVSASTHQRSAHLQWIWLCEYPNAEASVCNLFFVCASLITYTRQFGADPKLSTNSYRQFYRPPLVDTACPELWQA